MKIGETMASIFAPFQDKEPHPKSMLISPLPKDDPLIVTRPRFLVQIWKIEMETQLLLNLNLSIKIRNKLL